LARNLYKMNKIDKHFDRQIIFTKDGSHSLYVPDLEESYHSNFGAVQEAEHIFIKDALSFSVKKKKSLNILEIGFGTGLNAWLSLKYATRNRLELNYFGVEKYPLSIAEAQLLNYADKDLELGANFMKLHQADWGKWVKLNEYFHLFKLHSDFREMSLDAEFFDVVYFDAFGPDVQPELWKADVFKSTFAAMKPGGVLTTYSVKGNVRRAMKEVGFAVKKIPGPIGKREITRAIK